MTGEAALSVYRCPECGHGRHLWAWAGANVYGPLGEDGELDREDDVWIWGLYEDSIQCEKHPGAPLEHSVDGEWCRWWSCPKCRGEGLTGRYGDRYRYECREGLEVPGKHGPYKIHQGWRPGADHPEFHDHADSVRTDEVTR